MRFSLKNADTLLLGNVGLFMLIQRWGQSDFYILAYILLALWYDGTIEIALNFVVLCYNDNKDCILLYCM